MSEPYRSKQARSAYQYSQQMTAGKVASVRLLLQKAMTLIHQLQKRKQAGESNESLSEELIHCQNILAQLEMATNLRSGEAAIHIFYVWDLAYQNLENPTEKSLSIVAFLLNHFSETLEQAFPACPKPRNTH